MLFKSYEFKLRSLFSTKFLSTGSKNVWRESSSLAGVVVSLIGLYSALFSFWSSQFCKVARTWRKLFSISIELEFRGFESSFESLIGVISLKFSEALVLLTAEFASCTGTSSWVCLRAGLARLSFLFWLSNSTTFIDGFSSFVTDDVDYLIYFEFLMYPL